MSLHRNLSIACLLILLACFFLPIYAKNGFTGAAWQIALSQIAHGALRLTLLPIPFLCIVGIIANWRRGRGSLFLLPHSLLIIGSLLFGAWTVGFPDAIENLEGITFIAYLGIAVIAVLIVLGLRDLIRIYRSVALQYVAAVVVLLVGMCWVGYEITLYAIRESRNHPSVPLDEETILLVERNLGLKHPWKLENIDIYTDGGCPYKISHPGLGMNPHERNPIVLALVEGG